jgi:hypothetical protein
MSDDLKDKFGSDEEYENFRNSYEDFKNRTGMFDSDYENRVAKIRLDIESLIYENFHFNSTEYFRIPDAVFGVPFMSLYMFHLTNDKLIYFDEIINLFMN